MRVLFLILFLLITSATFSQCNKPISKKIKNLGDIPYVMVNRDIYESKSGEIIYIKISDVYFKSKLKFIFQSNNLGDTLDVSMVAINRRVLVRKKITNEDCEINYQPFPNSGYYFFVIQTKKVLDEENRPIKGCVGLITLERVTKKGFRKLQKVKWKKNYK
jgi:hypothetical protein